MPLLPVSNRDVTAPFVGETEFIEPENEVEQVKIYIHLARPVFMDDALQADFGSNSTEKVDFVQVIKSYVR